MTSPNPRLVDLAIDLLEPGDSEPLELSDVSAAALEQRLAALFDSDELLDNVMGLLELAHHARGYALDEIAERLVRVASTAADALVRQSGRDPQVLRERLGLGPRELLAPQLDDAPPQSAVRLHHIGAPDVEAVRRKLEADRQGDS